ncbi:MAG: flagellar biosynthesis anti-sigma factor FlgM [Pseudohongiellaceae bacterium]|jgi:flagellar biosynthesis anti-sigma factor FlgM
MNPINPSTGKAAEMLAMQEKQRTDNRQPEKPGGSAVGDTKATQESGKPVALSESVESALKAADFDQSKVAAMKEAIQSGNYPLDASKVAENFLPLERLL